MKRTRATKAQQVTLGQLLPALVLLGAVTLLQWHGWKFWSTYVGPSGWAWSLLLELAALWLWVDHRRTRHLLAFVTSLLLLAGPMYSIAEPLLDAARAGRHAQATRAVEIEALQDQVQSAEHALAIALRNSEKRAGWAATIQQSQATLERARDALQARLARHESPAWQSAAVIVMQASALLIFQVGSVLAVRALAESRAGCGRQRGRVRSRRKPGDAAPQSRSGPLQALQEHRVATGTTIPRSVTYGRERAHRLASQQRDLFEAC